MFHKQFNLNVIGLLLASQSAVKLFDSAGGSIINISSAVITLGFPNASVHSGTKGAVDSITRSLAKELGIGKQQDIAGAAVFPASSDSSWIAGETFVISGGNR